MIIRHLGSEAYADEQNITYRMTTAAAHDQILSRTD